MKSQKKWKVNGDNQRNQLKKFLLKKDQVLKVLNQETLENQEILKPCINHKIMI